LYTVESCLHISLLASNSADEIYYRVTINSLAYFSSPSFRGQDA